MNNKPVLILMALSILLVSISTLELSYFLVWNRTESVPKGLYWVNRTGVLERGSLVVFEPQGSERELLEQGGFIGIDWPILKRVAGLSGDKVCRHNRDIWINDAHAGTAINRDDLPIWSGCTLLDETQVFLLNQHPRSLDGRYFGIQHIDQIAGTAIPIWTKSQSDTQIFDMDSLDIRQLRNSQESRRARLRDCHTRRSNPRSAHRFSGDRGPASRCTGFEDKTEAP